MRILRSLFPRLLGQRGQSVIEAIMAVAVLGIAAETTALLVRAMATQTVASRDRTFATEKALQMLEELRGLALTDSTTLSNLDSYDDGYCNTCTPIHPNFKYTLTTKIDVTSNTTTTPYTQILDSISAISPHSANPQRPGQGYAFVRYVNVKLDARDPNSRDIYVRVYAAKSNAGYSANESTTPPLPLSPTTPPLAEVYGVVHVQNVSLPPNQVLDVYFVALENVPGWWSRTSSLVPLMQASVVSLQAMNPGLVVRSHWIQTLSYGRDLEYTPELNAEAESVTVTGSLKKAYVYPSYVDYDYPSASNDYFYNPAWFLGRVNVGGYLPGTSGWPSNMESPNLGYALADQFNNSMRYPDELNLYTVLKNIAYKNGQPAPEPSWRILLEELNENDPTLQNCIIMNLHGAMVPLPPLRNYSDGARDPDYYYNLNGATTAPGVPVGALGSAYRSYRAVSQPENLWYPQSVTVGVNVYAWDANPNEISSDTPTGEVVDTITLFIPNASTANLYQIYRTQGNSATPYYRFVTGTAAAKAAIGGVGGTFITGYNSSGLSVVADVTTASMAGSNTFYADNYTPTGRSVSGLRIQLFGTTPTARYYTGPEYSVVPSP